MAESKIMADLRGWYTQILSVSITTSFVNYTCSDDITNYKFIYVATNGNGAPSTSSQSWDGMFIPVSMFINRRFGSFCISYPNMAYYIEFGIGSTTKQISAKASDGYSRGITVYGIK